MQGIMFKPWKHKVIKANPDRDWQTRRVMKPQPFIRDAVMRWTPKKGVDINMDDHADLAIPFARYKVGEVVYIKEAYRVIDFDIRDIDNDFQRTKVEYKLDGETHWVVKPKEKQITIPDNWHYPMFMPAWAARDFIKILDVRPERLYAVTDEDAIAEGIRLPGRPELNILSSGKFRQAYAMLWDSINPKYPWASNCWVFVDTFRKEVKS